MPEELYAIPFSKANIVREGNDAYGLTVPRSIEAARTLEKEGIEAEVIDLRPLSPLDIGTVLESVEKTGRPVVADEASPRCNIATDISAQVCQQAFGTLKAGIQMVSPHVPVPFSNVLEKIYLPSGKQIAEANHRRGRNGLNRAQAV